MSTHRSSYRIAANEVKVCNEQQEGYKYLKLPEEVGHCYSEALELEPGILLGLLQYHPTKRIIEESNGPHSGPVMAITIGIKGKSLYKTRRNSEILFQAGHTTITTFDAINGERHYEDGQATSQIRLIVHKNALQKYFGIERTQKLFHTEALNRLSFHKNSPATTAHAQALIRYLRVQYEEKSTLHPQLHLKIHALSLLAEKFHLLSPTQTSKEKQFSTTDIQLIEKARNILISELAHPITIGYLSSSVGINTHKLKEGFHYLYNTTPMSLLLDLRMRKAYTLLEAGQQVAQAAWQVGYKYPNNFSVAFTKYFGRTPKSIFGKKR